MATLRRVGSVASVVAVLAGAVVGGRAAHRWMTVTARFGAREIEVLGTSHTTRDEVLSAARIQPEVNVLGIDAQAAERAIAQLPWVDEVHVTRRLPGYVKIELHERTPVAIVSAGGPYLCSVDGTVFKRVQPGDPDDLPVITGIDRALFEHDPDTAREYVRDALALLADIDASALSGRIRVDEVHRDPTGDLSIALATTNTYVWLGLGPYRSKLTRLSAILTELERDQLVAAEIHLDSDRHPERAVVRLPPVPEPTEPAPARRTATDASPARSASATHLAAAHPARSDHPASSARSERHASVRAHARSPHAVGR